MLQISLSALTTVGFVGAVLGETKSAALLGLVLSAVLLALNSYTKDYDLGELAQKHKQAAADLWEIRERYLSLLVDLAINLDSLEVIRGRRDELLGHLHSVYTGAATTSFQAYRQAQAALKKFEDMTFTDAEIDAFLPGELKRA